MQKLIVLCSFLLFAIMSNSEVLDELAVEKLREYLIIPTAHPNVDYFSAVEFLKYLAKDIELSIDVLRIRADKPIVIFEWPGQNSSLQSLLFNSHMDVVPAYKDHWNYPPFGAEMDRDGNIYARGAQDTKTLGIQYLEAIRRLKLQGFKPKRTIYVTFVPDEETGGSLGMKEFVKTDRFKKMNIGFAFDEGDIHPSWGHFFVTYGEKTAWHVLIKCTGPGGHSSLLLSNTAAEKMSIIMDKFRMFRGLEKKGVRNSRFNDDNVTVINLTKIKGGMQENIIPNEMTAIFDIRIGVGVDLNKFESMIQDWCREAGDGVSYKITFKNHFVEPTILDENPYWAVFENTLIALNYEIEKHITPATSDARFLRQAGVPTIGFHAMNNMTSKIHDNDEYVNKDIFLNGIEIFEKIMMNLGNQEVGSHA